MFELSATAVMWRVKQRDRLNVRDRQRRDDERMGR